MIHKDFNRAVYVAGFSVSDAATLGRAAAKIGWYPTASFSAVQAMLHISAKTSALVLLDADGIDVFGPSLVSEIKSFNKNAAVVCASDALFPGFLDQLERAGSDLVVGRDPLLLSAQKLVANEPGALSTRSLACNGHGDARIQAKSRALRRALLDVAQYVRANDTDRRQETQQLKKVER